jgi:structural maintenance of chromosome 1
LLNATKELSNKEKALNEASKALLTVTSSSEEISFQMSALQLRLEELSATKQKLLSENDRGLVESASLESEITELSQQISALEEEIASLTSSTVVKSTSNKKTSRKGAITASNDTETILNSLSEADRAEYNQLKSKERQLTVDLRNQLEVLMKEDDVDVNLISKHQSTLHSSQNRMKELNKDLVNVESKIADIQKARNVLTGEHRDKEHELREMKTKLQQDIERNEVLGSELLEIKNALMNMIDAKKKSESEVKIENAIADMKNSFSSSIRGKLIELIDPSAKKYNVAISITVGKFLDAIVVQDDATAFQCIDYLRERRIKPLQFLPIASIEPKEVDDRLVSFLASKAGSSYRLARDVVTYEPDLERIVHFACGNTVIADNLQAAKELRFKRNFDVKVVTLDGTVINRNGNMTGGSFQSNNAHDDIFGNHGSSRWDEKQLKVIEERKEKLLQEEEELRRRLSRVNISSSSVNSNAGAPVTSLYAYIEELENALISNQSKHSVLSRTFESLEKKLLEVQKEVSTLKLSIDSTQPEVSSLETRIQARKDSIVSLQTQINVIYKEIFGDFMKRLNVSNLQEYETNFLTRISTMQKKLSLLITSRTQLMSKLEYERQRHDVKRLSDIDIRISEVGNNISQLKNKLVSASKDVTSSKNKEAVLREEFATLKNSIYILEKQRDELSSSRRAFNEIKLNLKKKLLASETLLERFMQQRHDMLEKCRLQEISIPLLQGDEEDEDQMIDTSPVSSKKRKGSRSKSMPENVSMKKSRSASNGELFSQDNSASTSVDSEGNLLSDVLAMDARRSDRIDFSHFEDDGSMSDADWLNNSVLDGRNAKYEIAIHEMESSLAKMSPNMKASSLFAELEQKASQETQEYEVAHTRVLTCEAAHNKVRDIRRKLFTSAFKAVSKAIGPIYKQFTMSSAHPMGGTASITLDHPEELFDDDECGLRYGVMPPGKQFRELQVLSGGEKTIAALSLLFAFHSYRPSPFMVMDEIDAALDNVNLLKVANYIRKITSIPHQPIMHGNNDSMNSQDDSKQSSPTALQAIVISLKDSFYEKANGIVGVYRDVPGNTSRVLTLDLASYPSGKSSNVA